MTEDKSPEHKSLELSVLTINPFTSEIQTETSDEKKPKPSFKPAAFTDFHTASIAINYSDLTDEQKEKMIVYKRKGRQAIQVGFFAPLQRKLSKKSFDFASKLESFLKEKKQTEEEIQVCDEQIRSFYDKRKQLKQKLKSVRKSIESLPSDPIAPDTEDLVVNLTQFRVGS